MVKRMKRMDADASVRKVCFIMPNMVGGGAERVVSVLVGQFADMGIDTTLYLVKQNLVEYPINPQVKLDVSRCGRKKNPIAQIMDIRSIMKENPDAVFVSFLPYQNVYLAAASVFLKNRIVVSLRNAPQRLEDGNKMLQFATRIAFRMADGIVFQTKDALDFYSKAIQKKGRVILNPLQSNFPDYNVQNTEKKIITFCRLQPQKNLRMAIRAFKAFHDENPEYTYHIFGKGEEKANLLKLIEELDLQKCVFIEAFKKNILEEAKNYRAFMLTSDYEGLSNSMIEAIAMGIPSICTDCPIGGARMIIEDGKNGFLVPVGDEKTLVQKMKKITEMDTCVAVSEKAKKLKEQLDACVIAEQWCEVLFS